MIHPRIPTGKLRDLIEKQGGKLEDREAYYDYAEQTRMFANLNSVLQSFTMEATDFDTADPAKLTGEALNKLYTKHGLDEDGIQGFIAKLASLLFQGREDYEELATYFVEKDLVVRNALTLHFAFLTGYLYHRRNTTFVEEILAGSLKGSDGENNAKT